MQLKAARGTERLREMVSESGACGELTSIRVPLPLDPVILLNGAATLQLKTNHHAARVRGGHLT